MTKLHVGGFVARTKSVQTCAVNFIAGIFGGRHDAMFGFDRSIVLAKIFKTCADSCSVDSSGDQHEIVNDIDEFLPMMSILMMTLLTRFSIISPLSIAKLVEVTSSGTKSTSQLPLESFSLRLTLIRLLSFEEDDEGGQ